MSIFNLYKKRKFNELINDTFAFFRAYGRNYFTNYLVVNGALMVAATIISVFFLIFLGRSGVQAAIDPLAALSSMFLFIFLLFVLMVAVVLFVQCFPIAYAQLMEKEPHRDNFSSKEVFALVKGMLGRMFLFGLISAFVIGIPYMMVLRVFAFLPEILLNVVSFFLGILFSLFVTQAMLLYVKDKVDYFTALAKTVEQLKVRFWDKVGATGVMSLIMLAFVVAGVIIPFILFLVLGGISGMQSGSLGIGLALLAFIILLLSLIIGFVASNLQLFLQLLIHFGEKEEKRLDEIDLIGKNEPEV